MTEEEIRHELARWIEAAHGVQREGVLANTVVKLLGEIAAQLARQSEIMEKRRSVPIMVEEVIEFLANQPTTGPKPGANPWSAPAPGWVATAPPPNADMGRVDVGGTGPPPVFVKTPTREEYERGRPECTCKMTVGSSTAIGQPPCPIHPPKWGG